MLYISTIPKMSCLQPKLNDPLHRSIHCDDATPSSTCNTGATDTATNKSQMSVIKYRHNTIRTPVGIHRHYFRLHRETLNPSDVSNIPACFNTWYNLGLIQKPKDQQACGSCFAFSSTEVLGNRYAIAIYNQLVQKNLISPSNVHDVSKIITNYLVSISVQDVLSCMSGSYGPNGRYVVGGCSVGGFAIGVWLAIKEHGGVCSENVYPYQSGDGRDLPCSLSPGTYPKYNVTDVYEVTHLTDANNVEAPMSAEVLSQNVNNMKIEIMKNGPVTATIAIYSDFMQLSKGQCLNNTVYVKGDNVQLCGYHSIQIIGWDDSSPRPFWICMNSWGPTWADSGIFFIAMHQNMAGIESDVSACMPDLEISILQSDAFLKSKISNDYPTAPTIGNNPDDDSSSSSTKWPFGLSSDEIFVVVAIVSIVVVIYYVKKRKQ